MKKNNPHKLHTQKAMELKNSIYLKIAKLNVYPMSQSSMISDLC
jgi:hypothetical protein